MARRERRLNAEMNVVPYIDVMMVLLVIFMVTAPMLTQGVSVELPKAPAEPVEVEQNQEPIVVTVNAEGLYFLSHGGKDTDPVELTLIQEQVSKILEQQPKTKVLVRGDKKVEYQMVIGLMVALQEAGAGTVGLVTEP
ncbi:protein TolR [Balneatrix alpica]|uniref:Tol-Pal system protein TolR n=1 Tax=Balneatrix alpica TaxID=75684 RepID=A0ABV5Z821_9GAMM|nr:protein TolR [Balneatrix alpica]